MILLPPDWSAVLTLETALIELLARATLLYFGFLTLVRLMPRRTGGEIATMVLIFVLLIAEAAAHSLGDYTSLADGGVLIAAFMGWNWLINASLDVRPYALVRFFPFYHCCSKAQFCTEVAQCGIRGTDGGVGESMPMSERNRLVSHWSFRSAIMVE